MDINIISIIFFFLIIINILLLLVCHSLKFISYHHHLRSNSLLSKLVRMYDIITLIATK